MTLTITAEQRGALCGQILDRLGGIDDIRIAVRLENYEAADRLGREYSDILRLVLGDLGWGEETGGPVDLTVPPDVLRRVFTRLRDLASNHAATVEEELQEARQMEERNRLVMEVCHEVLAALDGEAAPGRA
jgi:hypothetical protein